MFFRLLYLAVSASALLFSDFTRNEYITTSNGIDTIKYVPSSVGSKRIEGFYPIVPPKTEATLQYDIYFDKDFEWVLGGKLPGFRGGNKSVSTTGCVRPQPKNAWSFRLMWKSQGRISMYMYDQERIALNSACGISVTSGKDYLKRNVWYRFKLYIKLNSKANSKDGTARLYVNDSLVLERTGIPWYGYSGTGVVPVNYIFFSSFYGGDNPSWAPSKTTYIRFGNVSLY